MQEQKEQLTIFRLEEYQPIDHLMTPRSTRRKTPPKRRNRR